MNFQLLKQLVVCYLILDWINQQLGGKCSLVPHNGCKFCSSRSPLVSCLAPPVTPVRVKIAVNRTWMDVWVLQDTPAYKKTRK